MQAGLLSKFVMPVKFRHVRRYFPQDAARIRILDVGAGGDSCRMARRWFPNVEYHGIDKTDSNYFTTYRDDYRRMDAFYDLDLERSDLSEVPNSYFDAVLFTHCIEHISTGEFVVAKLAQKLRLGGVIYIEFPNPRSLRLPGLHHFSEDPTHVALYNFHQVAQFAINAGLRVLRGGTRRALPETLLLAPLGAVNAAVALARGDRRSFGRGLLDASGHADFVLAQRARVEVREGCHYWTTAPES